METKLFDLAQFNQNKNYCLEASAGTGKTYNIVEIVKKLVEENISLNQILIVTFTEKAAGELKDRIRKEIKNADVDNAPIYTIHSFCQNTIKEFGISAKLPLKLDVINDDDLNAFVNRYIRDGEIANNIFCMYKFFKTFNFEELKNIFVQGIKKYYLNKEYNEDSSIISLHEYQEYVDIHDIIEAFVMETDLDGLLNKNSNLKKHFDCLKNCTTNVYANKLATLIEEDYYNILNFNGNTFNENRLKAPDDVHETYLYFKKIKNIKKNVKGYKIIGVKYLKDFYKKWQIEKELNKSQTFDDMIRYVREAIVRDDLLKNKLKEKYTYAIIDEFQDTNQRQFDIFKSIFMEDENHKIIVVGDPKQSIYSFQGADVKVYHKAVRNIIDINGDICRLNKNYRSTEEMVQSCNKLFKYFEFKGTTFEDCDSLRKGKDKEYLDVLFDGKSPKAFWIAESKNEEGLNAQEFAMIAVQQIIDCCTKNEIGETRLRVKERKENDFRNVSFKDFAVLARTKNELLPIEKALKNAGIPYLKYKDQKLFKGKECTHWIILLSAIISPDFTGRNRNVFKKALFTNFFGLTLKQINSEYVNKDDTEEMSSIYKWKLLAGKRNWKVLFDDILETSKLKDRLNSLKEIQSLAIYKQIADYCIEFLSRGKSIEELIRKLTYLSNDGSLDGDDLNGTIIEKSTNFDCVQLMTIHASKGLQFPIVIGVGGIKSRANLDRVYETYVKAENGKDQKILSFESSGEFLDEQIEEIKRLFYVAYTRAQFLLLLPNYASWGISFLKKAIQSFIENYKDCYLPIYNSYKKYDDLRKEVSIILLENSKEKEKSSNAKVQASKDDQNVILKQLVNSSNSKKIYKHSYSSLSHGTTEVIEVLEDEEDKEGTVETGLSMFDKLALPIIGRYNETLDPLDIPIDYPRGAKLGTALHETFEGLDFENYNIDLDKKITRCFEKQGIRIKDEWLNVTTLMVENVLNSSIPVIHGNKSLDEFIKLKDISFNNKLDEVEFNFNLEMVKLKNYCNGFVDLIFKNGDYYSILDWKSDRLNDEFVSYATVDSLKKHVDECYSIQRVLYSYCLIKWLKLSMPEKSYQNIFEEHFGGVYYVFLRGCNKDTSNGVYAQTWASWQDLEDSFNEIVKYKVGGINND